MENLYSKGLGDALLAQPSVRKGVAHPVHPGRAKVLIVQVVVEPNSTVMWALPVLPDPELRGSLCFRRGSGREETPVLTYGGFCWFASQLDLCCCANPCKTDGGAGCEEEVLERERESVCVSLQRPKERLFLPGLGSVVLLGRL